MDVIDYLKRYKDTSLKDMAFNEVDALALAMISYVPFDELGVDKTFFKPAYALEKLNDFIPPYGYNERKLKYLEVLRLICDGHRFDHLFFSDFKKERDTVSDKQFQAITILFNKYIYISYCGTDSTTLGWKEDFNMAYLEIVPSEVAAIKYANMILGKFWFRKVYLGGHSKGGRLAISAAKGLNNKRRIEAIFAFDAPNFPTSCYNQDYKKIDSLIVAFAPNESIIGRLMPEYHQKRIVKSTNWFIKQHDAFSWVIDDKSFVYESDYTPRSTRFVNTINHALTTYDDETKNQFIDTLFDVLDRMEVEKLPNENEFIPRLIKGTPHFLREFKNAPREKRFIVYKVVFDLVKDFFLNK